MYLTDALQSRAFSYVNGQLNFLPALHPDDPSVAAAINDAGTVVGSVGGPFGLVGPAVAWTPDGIQELTGRQGMGTAINNRGTIVGYDQGNSGLDTAAFIKYSDGRVHIWFPPSGEASVAFDVNSADVAVGSYYYPQLWDSRGVLFIKDTQLWLDDLIDPASGWQITEAGAINDAGEILATGCRAGVCSSVMLMPVPEPGEAALLVIGLLVLAGWRWRTGQTRGR